MNGERRKMELLCCPHYTPAHMEAALPGSWQLLDPTHSRPTVVLNCWVIYIAGYRPQRKWPGPPSQMPPCVLPGKKQPCVCRKDRLVSPLKKLEHFKSRKRSEWIVKGSWCQIVQKKKSMWQQKPREDRIISVIKKMRQDSPIGASEKQNKHKGHGPLWNNLICENGQVSFPECSLSPR